MFDFLRSAFRPCLVRVTILSILLEQSVVAKNLFHDDTSFEAGIGSTLTGALVGRPRLEVDAFDAVHGEQSLKMTFSKGEKTFGSTQSFAPGRHTFSFYARADQPSRMLVQWVRSDWRHAPSGKVLEIGTEWKRYHLSVVLNGGDYRTTFQLKNDGVLWVDAMMMTKGDDTPAYEESDEPLLGVEFNSRADRVYFPGEPVVAKVALARIKPARDEADRLEITVTDWEGRRIFHRLTEIADVEPGKAIRQEVRLPDLSRFGLYSLRALHTRGQEEREQVATFAVVEPPVALARPPFAGINHPNSEGTYRLGGRWIGLGAQWSGLEPVRGEYHWSVLDQFMRHRHPDEKVILLITGHPEWSWDKEETRQAKEKGIAIPPLPGMLIDRAYLEDWRRFIQELVKRYKDQVSAWEIGGEDDLIWGEHPYYTTLNGKGTLEGTGVYERRAEMAAMAAEEIRKLAPEARVGTVRPSGVDCHQGRFPYTREILKRIPGTLNALPLDPYPSNHQLTATTHRVHTPEETLLPVFAAAEKLAAEFQPNARPYISEFGYSVATGTQPDHPVARLHAAFLARAFLVSRASLKIEMMRWYVSFGGDGATFSYGIWHGRNPTLAVPAFSAMRSRVENVREAWQDHPGEGVWSVAFAKENQADGALWKENGEEEFSFASENAGELRFFDLMGNPLEPEVREGRVRLKVTGEPVYLRAGGDDAFETLREFLQSARSASVPVAVTLRTPTYRQGVLAVRNTGREALQVSLQVNAMPLPGSGRFVLKEGEQREFALDLAEGVQNLEVRCITGDGREPFTKTFPVRLVGIPEMRGKVAVDGDLREWRQLPPVAVLDQKKFLFPQDWYIWDGVRDLGAKIWFAWDETHLYYAAEVSDQQHVNIQPLQRLWSGDSIEIGLDPKNHSHISELRFLPDDFDFSLALGSDGRKRFQQWEGPVRLLDDEDFAIVRDEPHGKTYYEVRMPWKRIGITPAPGLVLGAACTIFDDDHGSKARIWMEWGSGLTRTKAPALFPRIYLKQTDGEPAAAHQDNAL